jgi:predicted secreted protein
MSTCTSLPSLYKGWSNKGNPMKPLSLAFALACGAITVASAGPVAAQTLPPPENVVSLSASATVEVPQDWLSVTLSTTREGPEADRVQAQLKEALDAALAEARKLAKPGQVEVRTGNFSLRPRYTSKGGSSGWTGQTDLVVEGRDMATIAQLTGRIQTLTIQRVSHSLSREAKERVEADVMAEAVARYRAQADQAAKLFGFSGWLLREVNLGGQASMRSAPVLMRAQMADASMASAPLPVEAGNATVTANVNGSIQLTR